MGLPISVMRYERNENVGRERERKNTTVRQVYSYFQYQSSVVGVRSCSIPTTTPRFSVVVDALLPLTMNIDFQSL